MGLPVQPPQQPQKKVYPQALPPNPKLEALKSEEEKQADALIKSLELEAAEKKAAAKAA